MFSRVKKAARVKTWGMDAWLEKMIELEKKKK